MGKHSRKENDPAQKARQFDELDEVYTRKGREKEERQQREKYQVVDSSGSGDGCAIIGAGLLAGLGTLGYFAARVKGLA